MVQFYIYQPNQRLLNYLETLIIESGNCLHASKYSSTNGTKRLYVPHPFGESKVLKNSGLDFKSNNPFSNNGMISIAFVIDFSSNSYSPLLSFYGIL